MKQSAKESHLEVTKSDQTIAATIRMARVGS
jgi:hypothetical protein